MRQVLVITRITRNPEHAESEFFSGGSDHMSARFGDIVLDMYDGVKLFARDPAEVANKIVSKVQATAEEVLIITHYDHFETLDKLLFAHPGGLQWQTARYSATNENYESEIRPALERVGDDPSQVEKIYGLFAADPFLEAKLNLLHQCLLPESAPASDADLPFRLRSNEDYVSAYNAFLLVRNNKTNKDALEESYVVALKKLRDVLLADY